MSLYLSSIHLNSLIIIHVYEEDTHVPRKTTSWELENLGVVVNDNAESQQNHLTSLSTLLHTIRKAYLSLSDPPPLSGRHPRNHASASSLQGGGGDEDDELRRWEGSKWLSDRERDEIDLRGRMILRRCREMVSELERAEKSTSWTGSALPPSPPLSRPRTPTCFLYHCCFSSRRRVDYGAMSGT